MSRWGRRRRGGYNRFDFYEYAPTLEAKGGIKSQSKKGSFGESWWAKRWISVLESFNIGSRLMRGRSYARRGQVLEIDIAQGKVMAKVQGSRPTPYAITITIKTLAEADWKSLAEALATQAIFAAKLLAGEMPQEIEKSFINARLSLFPASLNELKTNCSCPDWSNPCKHIAAVYYLIGEEFDRDPFLIFKLRGILREEFLELLGTGSPQKSSRGKPKAVAATMEASIPVEPLAAGIDKFWQGASLPEGFFGEVSIPPVAAALPRRLGNFPFWRGSKPLIDAIEPFYVNASAQALDAFLGKSE